MSDTVEKKQGLRKQRAGIVVSTRMDKTIVVEFIARVPHPKRTSAAQPGASTNLGEHVQESSAEAPRDPGFTRR